MNTSQDQKQEQHISLQVVTTSGNYPDEGYREFNQHEKLSIILHQAADELKLKNTDGWLAQVGERQLDPAKTLAENSLTDNTRIQWGPVERGGGACIQQ
jgi:hypothetical protein